MLGVRCSVLGTRYSVLGARRSMLNAQRPAFNARRAARGARTAAAGPRSRTPCAARLTRVQRRRPENAILACAARRAFRRSRADIGVRRRQSRACFGSIG
ncbi:hypothetical protein FKO59_36470 [Burkholderia pseudomallei]|nr:hypothetical protein BOC39_12970 [Burkholderia pseudomallei]ARL18559.1 hypothetical protein BOC46_24040 [Burkholderia pseudomallei]ARL91306.1 hypothetical protein BOC57_36915 [Burkholderia pseudomallei]NRE46786.1 hypothetical protein [Burkholderia pseudomallei]QDH32562.1 hypothetical protein FKO42_36515 [Burkholderia pseudomallei]